MRIDAGLGLWLKHYICEIIRTHIGNDSKINRWQIENSWVEGKNKEEDKNNGYYSMTDKWLEEYVFEIIVNKKYLLNDLKKKWNVNIQ